jgi:hypothetical protein
MTEELPHFLRNTKAYLILVSVLCSEMAGRAALLPILPLPGGAEHRRVPFHGRAVKRE